MIKKILHSIDEFILKNKETLFLTARNLTIVFFIVFILKIFNILFFLNLDLLTFVIFSVNTIAMIYYTRIKKNIEKVKTWFKYGFLISLLLITLGSLSFDFISSVTSLLKPYQITLTIISIFLGIITFYQNKEVINEVEKEKKAEETAEEKRKKNFAKVHPNMNRIPILKYLLKWMYVEGWWYSLVLLGILIFGSFFYFNGLGNYGFQGDEYYAAKVTNVYFETGKLFSLGNNSYTRAPLISLLSIGSRYLFNFLHINVSFEFIYRFPIVLISLCIIPLIYLLSKIYVNKKYALLITLVYSTEIWFVYFAKYLRFYAPTLFAILFILFINLTYKNEKTIYFSLLLSLVLYFGLTNYFLLLILFLTYLLFKKYVAERRYKLIVILLFLGAVFILEEYIRTLLYTTSNYNSAILSWNMIYITRLFNWLMLNYSFFLILFLSAILLVIYKKRDLYLYTIGNLVFFLLYIGNAQFNFTFRPAYFFLPLLICFAMIYLIYQLKNSKKIIMVIFSILILVNIYQSFNFNITRPGDKYYPTELIYEKMNIVEGTKDIPLFLDNYSANDKNVILLGLESLDQYSNINVVRRYCYSTSCPNSSLENFKKVIYQYQVNKTQLFIVAYSSSYANRINQLYQKLWGVDYVTELDPSFSTFVESSNQFGLIYTSKDGYSKIYLLKT